MTKEIGSEFHRVTPDSGNGLIFPRPGTLVFSGRTAIEAVLRKVPDAHTALLPSYCCESMIIPFRDAGINVSFYNVEWDKELIVHIEGSADILLWCNYFGYRNELPEFNGVIIEDITHSLLSDCASHSRSDYLVASLRKWEPLNCGGYCSVMFDGTPPPEEFINLKSSAMKLKADYLNEPLIEKKNSFLQMFKESNCWLAEHYSGRLIDTFSCNYLKKVDVENQRRIRRQNAKVLYEGLKNKVQFMFPIENMDCPLFVPIILPNRNKIREYLTKNEIYCPIHWPKPVECESNIYEFELSLICDQRYGVDDMERIVFTLNQVI